MNYHSFADNIVFITNDIEKVQNAARIQINQNPKKDRITMKLRKAKIMKTEENIIMSHGNQGIENIAQSK